MKSSPNMAAALRELRRPGDVALIVNELTPDSREALQDRTLSVVISTPLRQVCEETIALMINARENGLTDNPGQRFLPFQIWTPESL